MASFLKAWGYWLAGAVSVLGGLWYVTQRMNAGAVELGDGELFDDDEG